MPSVHDFTARRADGDGMRLDQFRGQVLLVVNVASRCGFTPQYAGLERLQRELGGRGFSVLGFPCNQFAGQEPGSDADIQQFCSSRYDVSFPVLARVEVNGDNADPLWRHLKTSRSGLLGTGGIKWNFTKFLVDGAGRVRDRFGPAVKPERIRPAIERLLQTTAA